MSDIRDFFIKTLDEAESGINQMMLKLMDKIKLVDPEVEAQLVSVSNFFDSSLHGKVTWCQFHQYFTSSFFI
jgi:hypothetical protein